MICYFPLHCELAVYKQLGFSKQQVTFHLRNKLIKRVKAPSLYHKHQKQEAEFFLFFTQFWRLLLRITVNVALPGITFFTQVFSRFFDMENF